MIYLILALVYTIFDQVSKWLVLNNIPYGSGIFICDYFNIIHVTNTGVAFSMFQGLNIFFILMTAAIVFGVSAFVFKYRSELTKLQMHSMTLIAAGGTGNLIDRIFRGAVIDFIDVGYKTVYRWPTFNIADSCVFIGVGLFVFSMLFNKKNKS